MRNRPRKRYLGTSDRKKDALLLSMELQIQYARSTEDSGRVRPACLAYIQNRLDDFYPERLDLVAELQALAAQLGGLLEMPRLCLKYA
jgi:hypothetical protein